MAQAFRPAPETSFKSIRSVDQTSAGRLIERQSERLVFGAFTAANLLDSAQVILGLLTVALFELPQPVILPGPNVVRIGLQSALVPDLRDLVVAELAVGIADQVGDVGAVILAECLQLLDRRSVVVPIIDRRVGRPIAFEEFGIIDAGALVLLLLLGVLVGIRGRGGRLAARRPGSIDHGNRHQCGYKHGKRQKSDRKSGHASLLMSLGQFYIEARPIEHPPLPIIPDTFFWFFGNFFSRRSSSKHEGYVIEMNEVRCRASGRVQRTAVSFAGTIDEPGNLAGKFVIPSKEDAPCSRPFPPHCSQFRFSPLPRLPQAPARQPRRPRPSRLKRTNRLTRTRVRSTPMPGWAAIMSGIPATIVPTRRW